MGARSVAWRLASGSTAGWFGLVRGPLEGPDDRIRRGGRRVGGRNPLGPAEPVPPVLSGGIECGDDVAALGMIVRVLHEQGRKTPSRGGDVGAPAAGAQLRR